MRVDLVVLASKESDHFVLVKFVALKSKLCTLGNSG